MLGALKAAYLKGITVHTGLSITGFGGYEMIEIIHPGLTTVKLQCEDLERKAAEGLVSLLKGEQIPLWSLSEYRVIERNSFDNKFGGEYNLIMKAFTF